MGGFVGRSEELRSLERAVADRASAVLPDSRPLRDPVRSAARDASLVVVLDDVRWADLPSLHVLVLVCRTARTERLCIFRTVREPNESSSDVRSLLASVRREATTLALGALERGDLAELARSRDLDGDAAIDALARATTGNPLFAVEVLEDRDARNAVGGRRSVPAPRGVRDVLERHLVKSEAFARVLGDRDPTSLGRIRHLFAAFPDDANDDVAAAALAAAHPRARGSPTRTRRCSPRRSSGSATSKGRRGEAGVRRGLDHRAHDDRCVASARAALAEAVQRVDAAGIDDAGLRCALDARLAAALQPMTDPRRALDTA